MFVACNLQWLNCEIKVKRLNMGSCLSKSNGEDKKTDYDSDNATNYRVSPVTQTQGQRQGQGTRPPETQGNY